MSSLAYFIITSGNGLILQSASWDVKCEHRNIVRLRISVIIDHDDVASSILIVREFLVILRILAAKQM